jgi:hypothetical protein
MNTATTLKVTGSGNAKKPVKSEISVADLFVLEKQTALTADLTAITHTAPGTPDYALQNLVQNTGFGFVTADEGNTVLKVVLNLQTRVSELETKLKAIGLLA